MYGCVREREGEGGREGEGERGEKGGGEEGEGGRERARRSHSGSMSSHPKHVQVGLYL